MNPQILINILVGVTITLVSAIATGIASFAFKFGWNTNNELVKISGKVDILFDAYQKEVAAALAIIHKPHADAKELDDLLDKLKISMQKFFQHAISDEELISLTRKLEEISIDESKQAGERLAAAKVLGYIEMRCKMMQLGV